MLFGSARPIGRPSSATSPTSAPAAPARRSIDPIWPRCSAVTAGGLDEARPDAVERRRVARAGAPPGRTSPTSSTPGSFVEYGPLVIAAQSRRRDHDDLITRTPADGMIGGIGTVNGELFAGRDARAIAVSYDYTVMAGTQGHRNHRKKDRLFELAEQLDCPSCSTPRVAAGDPATPTPAA